MGINADRAKEMVGEASFSAWMVVFWYGSIVGVASPW